MSSDSVPSSRGRDTSASCSTQSSPATSRSSSVSSRPKVYKCDYDGCDKIYSRPVLLTEHQRTHTGVRPFLCSECDASFYKNSHLKRHMLIHMEEKPFKCSICGKGVNTQQHLRRHEITHQKSFKCEYEGCSEAFYKHQALRHHLQSVHLKSLACKECGKDFSRPYRLANHMEKHHGASPAYQCDYPGCFTNFKTWSALQLHMKTDHPKLTCTMCGKRCVGQDGLKMHMLVHDNNTAIKRWRCSECPLDFIKKEELLNHCSEVHKFVPNGVQQQEKFFHTGRVENIITRGNSSASDFLVRSVGAPVRTIPCTRSKCFRVFKREYDLQRHLRWHDKQDSFLAADDTSKEIISPEREMGLHLANEH